MSFGVECVALDLHSALLVELNELFLMVKHFLQEFLSASASTVLLTTAHLLLEPVKSASLFFALGEHFGASVKISVNQLSFEE